MLYSHYQPTSRPQKKSIRPTAFLLLFLIILIIGGYFAFQKYSFWKKHRLDPNLQPTELEKNLVTPEEQALQTAQKKELDPEIDSASWKTFEDKTVGFTFKYPATVMHPQKPNSACPLATFQDPKIKTVTLTFACLYPKLTDWQAARQKNADIPLGLVIHYATAKDEKDLENLAENTFGQNCHLGPSFDYAGQTATQKYEIAPGQTACPTQTPHMLLFRPTTKTALALSQTPQAQFLSVTSADKKAQELDDEIINSLQLK